MTHLVHAGTRIDRRELVEHLATRIHAHICISSCDNGPGVADRNAAETVLNVLHDLDLLGPLETPQFRLVDNEALITWPDDVDRVLIHRPLMDKIVARINTLTALATYIEPGPVPDHG